MLDAYIIDAIHQEQRVRERAWRNTQHIQLEVPRVGWEGPEITPEVEGERGVVVIPLRPSDSSTEDGRLSLRLESVP